MKNWEEAYRTVCEQLREGSYKLTSQRKIILKIFLENAERHLSAEDVYLLLKSQHPEIGLATVYRTLELLVELNVLQKNDFGDRKGRYEFSAQDEHHHHHLICTECGEVSEFDGDLLDSLESIIQKRKGFRVTDHMLKFVGYCAKCQGGNVD